MVRGCRHLSGWGVVIGCITDITRLRLGEDVLDDGEGEETRCAHLVAHFSGLNAVGLVVVPGVACVRSGERRWLQGDVSKAENSLCATT